MLYLWKRNSKISFHKWPPCPMARVSRQLMQGNSLHAPLSGCSRKIPLPPGGGWWGSGVARCHMVHASLTQNKGAYIEFETWRAIPTQGNKLSTGCVGPLFQVQGPLLRSWIGDACMRLPSRTIRTLSWWVMFMTCFWPIPHEGVTAWFRGAERVTRARLKARGKHGTFLHISLCFVDSKGNRELD